MKALLACVLVCGLAGCAKQPESNVAQLCGSLTAKDEGKEVTVNGIVAKVETMMSLLVGSLGDADASAGYCVTFKDGDWQLAYFTDDKLPVGKQVSVKGKVVKVEGKEAVLYAPGFQPKK